MKPEQIAELRSTAAAAAREAEAAQGTAEEKVDRHGAFIDHQVLTRLLDEREALLDAARNLVAVVEADDRGGDEPGIAVRFATAGMDAAIAKAES